GKIRFATRKEDAGFDVVFKLTKTNSCKSAKENSEIHIPFMYESGFVDEVIQDEVIPIRIDDEGDEEKREKIEAFLIEKGIINHIVDSEVETKNDENEAEKLDKPASDVLHLKEEVEKPKKKRGRKKKDK
ncbi:MAG: hypothetical protein ACTSWD_08055, partial [Candidatus Heimdallarchaeota archaeon]